MAFSHIVMKRLLKAMSVNTRIVVSVSSFKFSLQLSILSDFTVITIVYSFHKQRYSFWMFLVRLFRALHPCISPKCHIKGV